MSPLLAGAGGAFTARIAWRAAARAAVTDRVGALAHSSTAWLPSSADRILAAALSRADIVITPEGAVECWLLAIVVVAGLAGAVAIPMGLVGAAAVALGGPTALWALRARAAHRACRALPTVVEQIASELRAGGTIVTAIHRLGAGSGLLERGLQRVDARLQLGATLAEALDAWTTEQPFAGVRAVAGALVLAGRVGGPAAGALDGLAASLATRNAVADETKAISAQARYSAFVVGLAPLGYLLFAVSVDHRALDSLTHTTVGLACLATGTALEILAACWMRIILREERMW